MAVFIETQTDPFAGNRIAEADRLRTSRNPGGVRRPVRGIEIKEDTYAVLRVLKADGEYVNVIDAAGNVLEGESSVARTNQYTNFFIQQVAEERHEKKQLVETFGDAFIFFFGESPRVTQVSGVLLNSADFNWRNEFWANYERYFRGTRLVEQNARLYLIYDDLIIEGYMLSAQAQDSASTPNLVQFNFTMFVTGYSTISALGDPNYPTPTGDLDYTQVSTYGEAVSRAKSNRAILKETNTEIARRNLRRSGGPIFGSASRLAAGIRNQTLNPDPSIAGTIGNLRGAYNNVTNLVQNLRSRNKDADNRSGIVPSGTRDLPLRSTFRDNTDEFIGGNEQMDSRALASPLNMAERWRKMDQAADRSLMDVIASPTSNEVFDLLGRGGRAIDEMRQRGSNPSYFRANTSRSFESSMRKVPFGMIAAEELT